MISMAWFHLVADTCVRRLNWSKLSWMKRAQCEERLFHDRFESASTKWRTQLAGFSVAFRKLKHAVSAESISSRFEA